MKKLCSSIILFLSFQGISANPIALPAIEISELYFDETGAWKIELAYYGFGQEGLAVDSIYLFSTTSAVKLPSYEFGGSSGVLVVTADSLAADFNVGRLADELRVVYYTMGYEFEDILVFGDLQAATISYPRQGQSQYWGQPLKKARYSLTCDPSVHIEGFSIKPDSVCKNISYWEKKNFSPEEDFKIWIK